MNRSKYFDYIEEKVNLLALRINIRGQLNILNLHVHSENFYRDFFNNLFDWKLSNLNKFTPYVEAIDLVSDTQKKFVQVSATATKKKIESALKKKIMQKYKDYNFIFISISKDASGLRKHIYSNPYGISFNPKKDIHDTTSILKEVDSLVIDHQKEIYKFIKKELGSEVDIEKLDSNLACIVNILSEIDLDTKDQSVTVDSFEIERKISFNNLKDSSHIINDYSIHHNRLDQIYSEYDMSGVNKSSSVLEAIRGEYVKNLGVKKDNQLFHLVIANVQKRVLDSANLTKIPIEEIELCINILVVDAFIRCKIFKNPKNYKYATSR